MSRTLVIILVLGVLGVGAYFLLKKVPAPRTEPRSISPGTPAGLRPPLAATVSGPAAPPRAPQPSVWSVLGDVLSTTIHTSGTSTLQAPTFATGDRGAGDRPLPLNLNAAPTTPTVSGFLFGGSGTREQTADEFFAGG